MSFEDFREVKWFDHKCSLEHSTMHCSVLKVAIQSCASGYGIW